MRYLAITLFAFANFIPYSFAQDSSSNETVTKTSVDNQAIKKTSRQEVDVSNITANFNLAFTSLGISSGGGNLSGPGMELVLGYSISEKWGVGGSVKQMNFSAGSGTGFSFRGTYAIWGKLVNNKEKYFYDNDLLVENKDIEVPCLCAQFMFSQYYLNATASTVPFTGYGAGIFYKYPTVKWQNLIAGIQYESMSNNETLTAMSLYFGIEFRI